MEDITESVLNNHYKETYSLIKTKYNYWPVSIFIENGEIHIPKFTHTNFVDIASPTLTQCSFCHLKLYITGFKYEDKLFCAECANGSQSIISKQYSQEFSVLYLKSFLTNSYCNNTISLLTTISHDIAIIRIRTQIDMIANKLVKFLVIHTHSLCWTCDSHRRDVHFMCKLDESSLNPIICVSCFNLIRDLIEKRLRIKTHLIGEFNIVYDIMNIIRKYLVKDYLNIMLY